MPLTPDQVDDLYLLTQPYYPRAKWVDISAQYPDLVSSQVLTDKRVTVRGGPEIKWPLTVKNTGNATNSAGLFATVETAVEDITVMATVPWAKVVSSYVYDVDEPLFQSDRETIVSELQIRDFDCQLGMAELHEENLFSAPSSTTDTRPMGIPFWVQKDATTTVGGAFNGGNPLTHSSGCAGVSSTTYPAWRNWTFGYTNVTVDDLIKKIKKSMYNTRFRSPVPHPELGYGPASYVMYTTYAVREPAERLAETRNDNLGNDLARYRDDVLVAGVPMKAVHYLDSNDSTDPVYGINWRVFRPFVLRGRWNERSRPIIPHKQPSVRIIYVTGWYNYKCLNRRALWVGSTS